MRFEIKRSGGFANIQATKVIDSEKLPGEEAEELKRLVQCSGFFELPRALRSERGADRFQYSITVDDGEKKHTITVDEGSAPEELKALIRSLNSAPNTG